MKKAIRSIFITIGLGTFIFIPMLILDNGLNGTLISVLIWTGASFLYGLSFLMWNLKSKIKIPLHIAVCFIITIAVRCFYSFFTDGAVNFAKIFLITIPIFIVVYVILYLFMKFIGDWKTDKEQEK